VTQRPQRPNDVLGNPAPESPGTRFTPGPICRIIKPGGLACLIGPVHPTFWLSRLFADAWMLFPTEAEYLEWFQRAGFQDVQIKRIGPKWYRGVRRHGLIMGCSVTGRKTKVICHHVLSGAPPPARGGGRAGGFHPPPPPPWGHPRPFLDLLQCSQLSGFNLRRFK